MSRRHHVESRSLPHQYFLTLRSPPEQIHLEKGTECTYFLVKFHGNNTHRKNTCLSERKLSKVIRFLILALISKFVVEKNCFAEHSTSRRR